MKISILRPKRSSGNTTYGIKLGAVGLLALISASTYAFDYSKLPPPVSETDFPVHSNEKVALGKMLFYDKILSGNRNISCATCHHGHIFMGDGLSLPVGEGGQGLGVARNTGALADLIYERVPRNAPHVFNLGAFEFTKMFHDGRVETDAKQPSRFRTPAGDDFPEGLDNALAAQAMFPVTSITEMAGQEGENSIADVAKQEDVLSIWNQLAERLQSVDEYVDLFKAAYPNEIINPSDITYVHAANAIGAYEDSAFRAINSPFDRYLRGSRQAMSKQAKKGMRLFYGKAGCSTCHSGSFQTDQQFHAIGMPQIGPGKGDTGPSGDSYGDFGREQVTGNSNDRYKFRTPTLRNVALTGPWGHNGAYNTLEAVVRHHLDVADALENYDATQAVLPYHPDLGDSDFVHHENAENRAAIASASELDRVKLKEHYVKLLMEFLYSLNDPASMDLRHTIPNRVPSGLPLAD